MSNEYKVETWWNLPSLLNGPKMTITDPRGSLGLLRSVSLKNEAEIVTEDPNAKWYDLLRYAAGIAEGPLEMRRVQSIPLECNLDWLEAVVFDKGCYVGQELMARTHFRGIIRKRIMPFKIPSDAGEAGGAPFKVKVDGGVEGIPSGGELFSVEPPDAKSMTEVHRMEMDAQPVGKVIGTLGNLGMALVRLPSWTEGHRFAVHRPTPSAGSCDQRQFVLVEPYKPHWWPPLNPAELL
jgi:folate-binding protein YgfZ